MKLKVEAFCGRARGRTYDTIEDACTDTGVSREAIVMSLSDASVTAGKWRFRFVPVDLQAALDLLTPTPTPVAPIIPTALEMFIEKRLHEAPGHLLPFGDFFAQFQKWLPPEDRGTWTKQKVSRSLPAKFASGVGNENKT